MNFLWSKTYLLAQSYSLPERVVTSEEIEEMLAPLYERYSLSPGRLKLMTGIDERRVASKEERPSSMAYKAFKELQKNNAFDPSKIGLLIYCGVSRDFLEPATASVLHSHLGLSAQCPFFDLSNACLGVMQGWWLAASWIEAGIVDMALIISAEQSEALLTKTVDNLLQNPHIDRSTLKSSLASLTIGSGAYASLLGSDRNCLNSRSYQLVGGAYEADSKAHNLCQGGNSQDGVGQLMQTDSVALMSAGIKLAQSLWPRFKSGLGWNETGIDRVITHQVGEGHHTALMEALGIDHLPTCLTYPQWGNMGSVALPATLAHAEELGDLQLENQHIALLGIGSGLSSLMLGLST